MASSSGKTLMGRRGAASARVTQILAQQPRAVESHAAAAVQRAVLFTDIVGSTAYFEQRGDTAGLAMIERHNRLLFPIIDEHRGRLIKTIGDAIMAAFDDEDDAVEAAIHMQQALEKHNQQNPVAIDRIYIRIGINTGETIQEYGDAYGDAVNVAARVCAKADGEQILVSEETQRELTRNRDIVNPHSRVSLKGKRDKFQLFQVDWLLADEEEDEPPSQQLPPDLSAAEDEDEPEPTGEATAVVQAEAPEGGVLDRAVDALDALANRARHRRDGPPGMLDRVFDFLGLEPTRKNAIALALIAGLLLLIVVALFFALCSGGAVEVAGDSAGRPPAAGEPFGPAGS
jgi:class 3 adenylate cyclase